VNIPAWHSLLTRSCAPIPVGECEDAVLPREPARGSDQACSYRALLEPLAANVTRNRAVDRVADAHVSAVMLWRCASAARRGRTTHDVMHAPISAKARRKEGAVTFERFLTGSPG